MINFTTTILKFGQQGDKTGWTYIIIPAELAAQLQPGSKKSFRVKGRLDEHAISGVTLLPMGQGDFMMPLNAGMRKAIGKKQGAVLNVKLSADKVPYQLNALLMACMGDEPAALQYFKSLPLAHQHYFSKWIDAAKTEPTKTRRIAQAVSALACKKGFSEMVREIKFKKDLLG